MSDISSMDRIVKDFGRDGLRFLFLFKTLKSQVQDELKRERKSLPNETTLNEVCAETANKLLKAGKEQPTEDEIREIIRKLRQ